MLIDSHCHLEFTQFTEDFDSVLKRARDVGISKMLSISTSIHDFASVVKIAAKSEDILISVGIHPEGVNDHGVVDNSHIIALCSSSKVVGIGETGLDYHYPDHNKELQKQNFIQHIKAAQFANLPVIVHTRDAGDDTLAIMSAMLKEKPYNAVIHCFTESMEFAKAALDLGFYISFSGIVTFKNALSLQEVAKFVPLSRMLVETDAPYLAPTPYRGKRNEPAFVSETAKFLADLKSVNYQDFCDITTSNFYKLFAKAWG
jgi:TatD DNase family protein